MEVREILLWYFSAHMPKALFFRGLIWVVFIAAAHILQAQTGNSVSDCSGAIVLCDDFYSEENASLSAGSVIEFTGICNNSAEVSSVWYQFTVQQDGLLSFVLTPNTAMDDYDWGLFDITTGGCAGIQPFGTSPEVSCNSYGSFTMNGPTGISTALGGTGNSNGPGDLSGPPFNADLPVLAGTTYALVVMNWTNSLDGYSIDFSSSTASLYDEIPPTPGTLEADCALSEFELTFSEPVLTSTVQPEDLLLIGPGGAQVTFATATPVGGGSEAAAFVLVPAAPVTADGMYTMTLTTVAAFVEDACGNQAEGTYSVELDVLVPPVAFGPVPVVRCEDEEVLLQAAAQPADQTYSYAWSAGTPAGAVSAVAADGTVDVVIETVPPCFTAAGSFEVVTEDCGLLIPNVITPGNGDALNNAFRIDGLDRWPGSTLTVFNRWGDELYTTTLMGPSAGWAADGAPEGTYYFVAEVARTDGRPLRIVDIAGERLEEGDGPIRLVGSFAVLR